VVFTLQENKCCVCGAYLENKIDNYYEEDYFYKDYLCKCGAVNQLCFDIRYLYTTKKAAN
jgi:hypothetical protein